MYYNWVGALAYMDLGEWEKAREMLEMVSPAFTCRLVASIQYRGLKWCSIWREIGCDSSGG